MQESSSTIWNIGNRRKRPNVCQFNLMKNDRIEKVLFLTLVMCVLLNSIQRYFKFN